MNTKQHRPISLKAYSIVRQSEALWCKFINTHKLTPSLAVIIVGAHKASSIYVQKKIKACVRIGIDSNVHQLTDNCREEDLIKLIKTLNKDVNCHGILVQSPLPKQFNIDKVFSCIDPNKDVDGFHPLNRGKHLLNQKTMIPCTTFGIIRLLKFYGIKLSGSNVALFGRSHIVGLPTQIALQHENATVTLYHSKSDIKHLSIKDFNIIILATGADMSHLIPLFHKEQTVIDVGIHSYNGKVCGDLGTEASAALSHAITPVPGGVGPMTVNSLMLNTLLCYLRSQPYDLSIELELIDETLYLKTK